MKITYWSDYACPYCYIGEERLKKAIEESGICEDVELEMKAFQLDPSAGIHAAGDTQTRFAHKYGIHAVPFFVIGRYGISGAQSREGMKAAIAKALEEQEAEILQAGSGMTCGPEGCRIG